MWLQRVASSQILQTSGVRAPASRVVPVREMSHQQFCDALRRSLVAFFAAKRAKRLVNRRHQRWLVR
jgi:hypothetical protein